MFPQHNAYSPYKETKLGANQGMTQQNIQKAIEPTTGQCSILPKHLVAEVTYTKHL